MNIKFNSKIGNLGLIAIDNTKEQSIKFINSELIPTDKISNSSRSITRILIDYDTDKLIKKTEQDFK
jgi:hypothetical protein